MRTPNEDIAAAIAQLAADRPIFHSEADFQHALAACQLHLAHPEASVRLEKQVAEHGQPRVHLDLLVTSRRSHVAIELKYKTALLECVVRGEPFSLRNQSAQDIGRHDFVKDISRLERYVSSRSGATGFAVLLTNDCGYWQESRKAAAVDTLFRLHEGRQLSGSLRWGDAASAGTTNGRSTPIHVAGSYGLTWVDYSEISGTRNGRFRILCVQVR